MTYGGIAHGIGAALYEKFSYTADGQWKAAPFMDYLLPSAMEVPAITIVDHCTPSPLTTFGQKGLGEAGYLGAPAAIANAINDALSPLGHLDRRAADDAIADLDADARRPRRQLAATGGMTLGGEIMNDRYMRPHCSLFGACRSPRAGRRRSAGSGAAQGGNRGVRGALARRLFAAGDQGAEAGRDERPRDQISRAHPGRLHRAIQLRRIPARRQRVAADGRSCRSPWR